MAIIRNPEINTFCQPVLHLKDFHGSKKTLQMLSYASEKNILLTNIKHKNLIQKVSFPLGTQRT